MGQVLSLPYKLFQTTMTYYSGLYYYIFGNGRTGPYNKDIVPPFLTSMHNSNRNNSNTKETISNESSTEKSNSSTISTQIQHIRIHLYSLACNFYLYDKPHYRKRTYREDLYDNLRNVAVPGTGMPLSWLAPPNSSILGKVRASYYLLITYPILSWIASIHYWYKSSFKSSISEEYKIRLLAPNDWFHYWRLNCTLVAMHSLFNSSTCNAGASVTAALTDTDSSSSSSSLVSVAKDYSMENKWTFLQEGDRLKIPVSPFIKDGQCYVIKHKNEEGGMGIYFYDNAVHGGNYIIQTKINNNKWLSSLLPSNAPLSTFRIITASRDYLYNNNNNNNNIVLTNTSKSTSPTDVHLIEALSCVFRAGRKGALTDHDSILFDVDIQTGTIGGGTTNKNWYQLGWYNGWIKCPWRLYDDVLHEKIKYHPDKEQSEQQQQQQQIPITGQVVPNFQSMIELCQRAHYEMCRSVPLAGWDVVLTDDPLLPICLLEVNLSCNFFRGSFHEPTYYDFMDEMFTNLQHQRIQADLTKKTFVSSLP